MITIKCAECNIKKEIESITKAKNKGWVRKNNKWYCPHCCENSYQSDTNEDSNYSSSHNNDDDDDSDDNSFSTNSFGGGSFSGGGAKW